MPEPPPPIVPPKAPLRVHQSTDLQNPGPGGSPGHKAPPRSPRGPEVPPPPARPGTRLPDADGDVKGPVSFGSAAALGGRVHLQRKVGVVQARVDVVPQGGLERKGGAWPGSSGWGCTSGRPACATRRVPGGLAALLALWQRPCWSWCWRHPDRPPRRAAGAHGLPLAGMSSAPASLPPPRSRGRGQTLRSSRQEDRHRWGQTALGRPPSRATDKRRPHILSRSPLGKTASPPPPAGPSAVS